MELSWVGSVWICVGWLRGVSMKTKLHGIFRMGLEVGWREG